MPLFRPPPCWVALVLLVGAAIAWSSFDVGFLSDDYLMAAYWHRQQGTVRWDLVAGDLYGPWLGVRDLWRPIVTLSCALQFALHGAEPRLFHLANAAMVTVAALAVAALVRLRFPAGRGALAAAAGAMLLLHPAVVEPSHWIMARTTALEVMFSALAMAGYAAFLCGRLRSRWPALVCTVLAFGSKEGALVLPVSLLAVDLLCRRAATRTRLQSVGPFWLLLLALLLARRLMLGYFTTARDDLALAELVGSAVAHAGWLLAPAGTGSFWLAALLLAALAVPALRQQPLRVVGGLIWLGILLLPASHVPGGEQTYCGRLVYHAVPALALLSTAAAATFASWWVPVSMLSLLLLAQAAATVRLAADYRAGGAAVAAIRGALEQAAGQARPGQPVATVAIATPPLPVQMLHPRLWGLLLARPFAAADYPVANLDVLLPRGGRGSADGVDAAPARAVLAAGGCLLEWTGAELRRYCAPPPAAPPQLLRQGDAGFRFTPAAPWAALTAGLVEVQLVAPAKTCRLRLSQDLPGEFAFGERIVTAADGGATTFWFDLESATAALILANQRLPWPGLEIRCDGVAPPAAASVRLHAGPQPVALPQPLHGERMAGAEFAGRLVPPPGEHVFYLLLPTTVVTVPCAHGAMPPWPLLARREFEFALGLLGEITVHWFWRSGDGTSMPQRTELDWCRLR